MCIASYNILLVLKNRRREPSCCGLMGSLIYGMDLLLKKQLSQLTLYLSLAVLQCQPQLVQRDNCICPGHILNYSCTVFGNGFTHWRGSSFSCLLSGNEITLPHSDFQDGISKQCNNGRITGESVKFNLQQNSYTSQLSVNVSRELNGKTVECAYDNNTAVTTIGLSTLRITSDPIPAPTNVKLIDAHRGMLTFSWKPVTLCCSDFYYEITNNCGNCPRTTKSTSIICSVLISSASRMCSLSVRSVTCGNIIGNWSDPVSVNLKVPESPVITEIVPLYSNFEGGKLTSLDVKFKDSERNFFNISNGIDGYTSYFSINLTLSDPDIRCGSVSIVVSSCLEGVCVAALPVSCFFVNSRVVVSIFASNRLGDGPMNSVIIDGTNQFFSLTYDSAGNIICQFVTEQNVVLCNILYGQCSGNLNKTAQGQATNTLGSVYISQRTDFQGSCFVVNASNGTFSVLMKGVYNSTTSSNNAENVTSTTIVVASVMFVLFVLSAIISSFVFLRCLWHRQRNY